MSNVEEFMKAMETPGALGEEGLLRVRKDWFDPLILEQHKMDAAGAFDGDSFSRPHQLIWEGEIRVRLPVFLMDFVREMSGIQFRAMTPSTRRTLWFGVRICFGLSESDFPYPEPLKALDRTKPHPVFPERIFPGPEAIRIPLGAVIGFCFIAGFFGYVIGLPDKHHAVTPASRAISTPPFSGRDPDYLSPSPSPERPLSGEGRDRVPGNPGHP